MKKATIIGVGMAIAVVFGVELAAQSSQTPSATQSTASAQTITVTGCLQRADQTPGATGTAGSTAGGATASGRAAADRFVLQNASIGKGASSGATSSTAQPPTSTAGTAGMAKPSYALEGHESDLRPHAGHQVEITGTLESASSSSTSTTAPAGTTSSTASSTQQKLRVESVKMISATCPSE
jgi:hypothetical protein